MNNIEAKTQELIDAIAEGNRISQELKVLRGSGPLPEKTKSLCTNCEDSFYHCNPPYKCWSFDKAEVVMKKLVGTNDVPPWNHKPIPMLSCYHRPGFVSVRSDQEQ